MSTAAGLSAVPLESQLTLSGIIIGPIIVIGLQFLLYGFYIMAFTVCMMVLKRRNRTRERAFHFTLMISLFALATLGLGINTALAVAQAAIGFYQRPVASEKDHAKPVLMIAHLLSVLRFLSFISTMLSNILADMVLIFRCYAIWNFQKRMIVIPTIACGVSNVIGIISMNIMVSAASNPSSTLVKWIDQATYLQAIYFIMNALINVALTSLVAGRIWFLGSKSQRYFTAQSLKRYTSIASIVLQSGLLYPLVLIISVPFSLLPSLSGWDLHPLLIQVAGICPTLMIVRVGLGVGVMAGNGNGPASGSFTLNVGCS